MKKSYTPYIVGGIVVVGALLLYSRRAKASTPSTGGTGGTGGGSTALPPSTPASQVPSGWVQYPGTGEWVPGYPGYIPQGTNPSRHAYIQAKIEQIMRLPGYDTWRSDRSYLSRNGYAIELYRQANSESPYPDEPKDSYYNYTYPGIEVVSLTETPQPTWWEENGSAVISFGKDVFEVFFGSGSSQSSGGTISTGETGGTVDVTDPTAGQYGGSANYSDTGG